MMSSIFYGEIKEDKLKTWFENRNPYDILVENNRVERLGGWDFLFIAKDLFTDEVQVEWGSFAYKCTRKQLQKLVSEMKCEIPKIQELDADKVYGRGNIGHISFKNLIQKHNTFCIKLILGECLSLALKELKRVCFLAFELYS